MAIDGTIKTLRYVSCHLSSAVIPRESKRPSASYRFLTLLLRYIQWSKTAARPGDPPLSGLGLQQARETGIFLKSLWKEDNITSDSVTWLSSPFLRCLQTSNAALDEICAATQDTPIPILPESAIFEWDNGTGELHASLPDSASERQHYFPRIDTNYTSLFVPPLPEPRSDFHDRCRRAVDAIGTHHFGGAAKQVVVAVSHAAGCIGLTAAATGLPRSAITPAAPCSVYRLTRRKGETQWTVDAHDAVRSLNGHTAHLTELGTKTVPWNNFGDKKHFRGYTGPPNSRFAPEGFTEQANKDEL